MRSWSAQPQTERSPDLPDAYRAVDTLLERAPDHALGAWHPGDREVTASPVTQFTTAPLIACATRSQ